MTTNKSNSSLSNGNHWGFKNNKSQAKAPRTILGLFPSIQNKGVKNVKRRPKDN